jgi:predicted transposase/invertase (TIGR01784 family)
MTTKKSEKPKHDQLFKAAMENPQVAYDFVKAHLPKDMLAIIDTSSLTVENVSFIEPKLTRSSSDVLFSAKFNDQDGYIFLLIEHQSTADKFMAFRLFKYMIRICDRYLKNNPKSKHLPLVYPVVLYNGIAEYDVARNLWDLFSNNHLAKQFWLNDYQLVNVHDISDEELKKRPWSGLLEFFLKYIHERDLFRRWQEIAYLLPQLTKVTIGYDYIEILLYYTLDFIDQNDKMNLEEILITTLNKEKGQEIMSSLAQHWKEEGIEKGIKKGIEIEKSRSEATIITIAKNLLKSGLSIDVIAESTGLSKSQIEDLKNHSDLTNN